MKEFNEIKFLSDIRFRPATKEELDHYRNYRIRKQKQEIRKQKIIEIYEKSN